MADEDPWLTLLQAEDVDGFNAKRTERTRIELFAADLSGKTLTGVDLSNANLEKSDLTGTDLTDANLMKTNLAGIDGSGAILKDALGLRARFKDAWMDGADLTGADLAQADFADANLSGSKGAGVRLAQARLRGVNASGAIWPGADLSEARLHQANFKGADLRNADLTEVGAGEADFTDAQLDGVSGSGAKLGGAKLVNAKLNAARLPGANLTKADLTGANLAAADLSRANLAGAILKDAILRGAVLADANLEGAVLDGADLSDADMTGLDPSALGLDDAAVGSLSGFGITYDDSAPLLFSDVSIARNGDAVAVVWENPEGEAPPPPPPVDGEEEQEPEEPRVLRFAVLRGGQWKTGVVPVPGESVLDRQVVPWADGFRIVVTRSRPEGAALLTATLSVDGVLGTARAVSLGYDPAVRPVMRTDGGKLRMFGLARRGPTFVVHDLTEGDPRPVRSDGASTARGFMKNHPVLACKGGVVMPVAHTGPAGPRRTPETFPGTIATALPVGDDVLALWAVKRAGSVPGGMRFAVIGRRHAPKEEILGRKAGVVALGAIEGPEAASVYWVEAGQDGLGATVLMTCRLPGGEPDEIDAPADITEMEVSPGVIGLVVSDGTLVVLDPETGRKLGTSPS